MIVQIGSVVAIQRMACKIGHENRQGVLICERIRESHGQAWALSFALTSQKRVCTPPDWFHYVGCREHRRESACEAESDEGDCCGLPASSDEGYLRSWMPQAASRGGDNNIVPRIAASFRNNIRPARQVLYSHAGRA